MIHTCYGLLRRLKAGGNWDNSSNCGSRSLNCNNLSSNGNGNNAVRGVSDISEDSIYIKVVIKTVPF